MRISDWSSDVCSSDLATGKIVTPGLVAAGTALGLIEVRAVETTDDRATDASELSAAFDAGYGLNPDSLLIPVRSEEHTSELQSLMRISYAVFCLKKKKNTT